MKKPLDNLNFITYFANLVFNEVKSDKDYEHPFFLIEILQRRKDNPNLDCPYKTLKWFAVYNVEQLLELCSASGEVIDFCNRTNSRAYFHVNIKDSRATVNSMLYLISKWSNFNNNTLEKLPECFYVAARQQESNIKLQNMFWVVDFDYKDDFILSDDSIMDLETIEPGSPGAFYENGFISQVRRTFLDFITQNLQKERKDFYNFNCIHVKTNHGFHLILPPFDLTKEIKSELPNHLEDSIKDFTKIIKPEVRLTDRIKKNNSTLLYMPS